MRPLPLPPRARRRPGPGPLLLPLAFALSLALPALLSALDPGGALKWGRPGPCGQDPLPCARARPLLLRSGPDGVGVFLADRPVPRGRWALAVDPATGLAIGTAVGGGTRVVVVRGLGDPERPLPVEAVEGVSAMLVGRGAGAVLRFRPHDLPVRGWATAGSAGGLPAGWPVLAEDPGQGMAPVPALSGPVGLVWE